MRFDPNRGNLAWWLSQKHILSAFAIVGVVWWIFLSKSASTPQDIEYNTKQDPPSNPVSKTKLDDITFAILTDDGYHKSHAQAIKRTWLSGVPHYHFFATQEIKDIPTTLIPGSSARLFPAIRYLLSNEESKLLKNLKGQTPEEKWRWLVIVDDSVFVNVDNLVDTIQNSYLSDLDTYPTIYANNSGGFPSEHRIHTFILNPTVLDELSRCNSLMFDSIVYSSAPCREDHNNDNRLVTCIEYFIGVSTTSVASRHLDLAFTDGLDWNDESLVRAVSLKNLSPEQMLQAAGKPSHIIGYYDANFSLQNILFGVLTTSIYHEIRVKSIIRPSWGDHVPLIAYYSESEDPSIPTTVVNSYTADAPEKECKILYQAYGQYMEYNEEVKWFVRVDDDTIVCPKKMEALLSRYDPSSPFYIGSCYVHYGEQVLLDFVPLGGGAAFSRSVMEKIVEYIDGTMGGCENAPLTEDPNVWIAKMMRDLGLGCTNENGFNMPQIRIPDNDLVTVHYIRDITDAIVLQTHHGCI